MSLVAPAVFLALAVAAPPPPADRATVEKSVRDVLGESRYRFCHDPSFPLLPREHGLCKLVTAERCPSLVEACKTEVDEPTERKLPDLGRFAMALLWGVILGGIAVALVFVARRFLRGRGGSDDAAEEETRATAEDLAAAGGVARGPVETEVDRLIALARVDAARGDFGRAIEHLYRAVLWRLDKGGAVRVRPWRTNGDYVRELAARPELRGEVRAIVADVERVQFGATPPSPELFETLLERVQRVVARPLLLLALLALAGSAAGCRGCRGDDDHTPSGTSAVAEVLTRAGLTVHHRIKSLDPVGKSDVLVLLPGVHPSTPTWNAVLAWVEAGGVLIVAGQVARLPESVGVATRTATATAAPVRLGPGAPSSLRRHNLQLALPPRLQLEVKAEAPSTLLARDADIYATDLPYGLGRVIVLADDDLFTNGALTAGDNALFLVSWLGNHSAEIELADEDTGQSPAHPGAALTRGPLAPVFGQLALLALLFFVWRGRHFGAPRDPPAALRRRFVDHVRAVGITFAKARASRHAFAHYAGFALDRLRERVRLGGSRALHPLAEAVAARTRRPVTPILKLLLEAQLAHDELLQPQLVATPARPRAPTEMDLRMAAELAELVSTMGGKAR